MNSDRTYDIFLSYPHADRVTVAKICKALHEKGLSVWMDESDIPDYASITRSIVDGLARSRVLVAYNSLNYAHSRACQWELTAAFLAAQREGDPRRRVLVINPENEFEHIQPVELRDAEIPDSDDLDRLVSRVKARVDEIEGEIGNIHALKPPTWYGRKGLGSNRFVGRLHYMWKIHSYLHAFKYPIITEAIAAYGVAQVYGMGGVGKSLLAEEYALRFAAAFPGGVFWLSAFGNDDAKAGLNAEGREAERSGQIRGIAANLGIPVQGRSPGEIEGDLKRELGSRKKSFLWVVDDLPAGMDEDTLQRWLAPHPLGKTLITTRTHEYGSLGNPIHLDVLEPDEAHELLISWRIPNGSEEENAAHKLLKDIGYHALAVDVAGAAIRASISPTPFIDFVNALTSPTEDELEFAKDLIGILPIGHETSIASTFLRSINDMGSEGLDFLRLASKLAVDPIPASLVVSVFREVDGLDEISGKQLATRAMHRAEELSLAERLEGDDAAFLVHTLISRTIRFQDPMPNRLGQLRDAAVSILTFVVHTLISRTIRFQEPMPNRLGELRNAVVSVLTDEFSKKAGDPRTHHALEPIINHARELVSRDEDIKTAALMAWVAQYDYVRGAYKFAENLWRLEWDTRHRILGSEHPSTIISMSNLAMTLQDQGDFEGARKFQEQVLEKVRRILGEEHLDTITSMGNLASTLRAQGDIERARKFQEQVLEKTRRILGEEHLDTITSMNNLALTLQDQGDFEGTRKLQEQVLEKMRRILGEEHLDTITSMSNLAMTLQDQGDFEGAQKFQEQVLEIRRRILVKEHPDTIESMGNLAATLRAQGDFEGARKFQEQVLEIRRRILGEEHLDTIKSMGNLASTLQDQGDIERARKFQEQILEKMRRILGEEHLDTITSMNNLALTLKAQGDFEGARKFQEQVLEKMRRILGEEHPDTITSMSNLAMTLYAQGDFEGARKFQEQVLEIRRRILGDEHPSTTRSMNNLAATLQAQGNLEGARKYQEQVLEMIWRILREEHPYTSISAWNLLNTLIEMGDTDEAKRILEKHLIWLLGRDPEALGADQRQIRELIIQKFQGAGLHE